MDTHCESVIARVCHDHVPLLVHGDAGGVAELALALPGAAEGAAGVALQVHHVDAVKAKVNDVQALAPGKETRCNQCCWSLQFTLLTKSFNPHSRHLLD